MKGSVMALCEFAHVPSILVTEHLAEFFIHQMLAQGTQNSFLQLIALDRLLVVASTLVSRIRTADPASGNCGATAAAGAAFNEIGKDVSRTVGLSKLCFLAQASLALSDLVPWFIIDDAEFWQVFDNPLLFRIEPWGALSCARIFHIAKAVPYHAANVELIVQNACSTLSIAVDGALTPRFAGRATNAFIV